MCKIIFWAFIRAIDIKPIQLKWSVKQASNNKNLMRTITAYSIDNGGLWFHHWNKKRKGKKDWIPGYALHLEYHCIDNQLIPPLKYTLTLATCIQTVPPHYLSYNWWEIPSTAIHTCDIMRLTSRCSLERWIGVIAAMINMPEKIFISLLVGCRLVLLRDDLFWFDIDALLYNPFFLLFTIK